MTRIFRPATLFFAFVVLCSALAADAAVDLISEFRPDKEDSRVKWTVPLAGPVCETKDGVIRVSIPQRQGGYNQWIESLNNAPTLRMDAPEGDWDLTCKLDLDEFAPSSGFHIGVTAGFADAMMCTFGPYHGPTVGVAGPPELWVETTGMPRFSVSKVDCSSIYLKMSKRDNVYSCYYRKSEGDEWAKSGEYLAAFVPKFVGLMAKTIDDGAGVTFSVRDFKLESAGHSNTAGVAAISVDPSKTFGKIDRNIYGHFIEHLGTCIAEGIWDEMLWNRKFTGGVNAQGLIDWWSPFGEGAKYSRDNREFYTSCQSQRIELAAGKEAGILKENARLGIKPGKYVARAILKQSGVSGPVTMALRQGDKVYASAMVPKLGAGWKEYKVELDVKERDPNAQFSLSTKGPGTLWVGCLSLMRSDNVQGMRRDVLEKIKAIKPPLIRWPGGNMVSGYHWEDALGNRDKRMPRWERAWNNWEWNDFGTDEYIQFCRWVGTEPYICVNAGEGQADEAAHWVEYCNGSVKTPYGKLRAKNGHPEPYHVKYWGIGNEMYGNWQLGYLDATKYALKSIEFARAMKAVDPSIKLVGVGVPWDGFGWWNTTVCQIAGSYYDYLSVHYYKGQRDNDPTELNYLNLICTSLEMDRIISETSDIVDKAAGRRIPLAFDEWNVDLHQAPGKKSTYALRDGLFTAAVLNSMQRQNDKITMANLAQLVNVLGALRTNMNDVVETPIYQAFDLYSNLCQDNRCELKCDCSSFDTPSGRMPLLDASATVSDDGRTLVLAVINRDPTRDIATKLDLKGFASGGDVELAVMNGPDVDSVNLLTAPATVGITRSKVKLDTSGNYTFPAHSVSVMTLVK